MLILLIHKLQKRQKVKGKRQKVQNIMKNNNKNQLKRKRLKKFAIS